MRKRRKAREVRELSAAVIHRLNMYALAASAAGVGILALAPPAEAKIVYTKTHKVLPPHSRVNLDLNHDGIPDFTFHRQSNYFDHHLAKWESLWINSARKGRANGILGSLYSTFSGSRFYYAVVLPSGTEVNAAGFPWGRMELEWIYPSYLKCWYRDKWRNEKRKYLGLSFAIKGQAHYGWARMNVIGCSANGISAVLTGYAYETVPGKPIITGKTKGRNVITIDERATLGQLARGASTGPGPRFGNSPSGERK